MTYISLDIETTGLEIDHHSIIEIGALIDDFQTPIDELPEFRCLVDNETIVANKYALGMHVDSGLLKELEDPDEDTLVLDPEEVAPAFKLWMVRNGIDHDGERFGKGKHGKAHPVGAGKNLASFDIPHLQTLPNWEDHIRFHHRVLDPGPLYFDPSEDEKPPNLQTCMERAGFENTETDHTSLADARDVIKLLRRAYGYHPEIGRRMSSARPELPFE